MVRTQDLSNFDVCPDYSINNKSYRVSWAAGGIWLITLFHEKFPADVVVSHDLEV